MKKIFITSIICLCISTALYGQKLTKKQARQILGKAISSLQSSDSTTFVSLWHFSGTPPACDNHPFTEKTAITYYHYLREFLDTALTHNLKIDNIDIEKTDAEQQALNFGKYNIKAWFKYADKYYKGFGFYMDFIEGKWVVRFSPDTSTMTCG
ncbi:MAG: hypothetical protein V4635_09610 [Bacteroidota bacterium]